MPNYYRMLNCESYPSWFNVPYHGNRLGMRLLFPRGFSANLVLFIWSVLGSVLMYGFLSLFREMLLKPEFETPVDTAQDVLDIGLIPFVHPRAVGYIDILKQSPDRVYQKLGEVMVVPKNEEEVIKMLKEDVQDAGTHIFLCNFLNPEWEKLGDYHWSKEELPGISPYSNWYVNKRWALNEEMAVHLLRSQQVWREPLSETWGSLEHLPFTTRPKAKA